MAIGPVIGVSIIGVAMLVGFGVGMGEQGTAQAKESRDRDESRDGEGHGKRLPENDRQIKAHAERMLEEGRNIFRFDTYGSEAFFGDALQLHRAIAGAKNGGVGGYAKKFVANTPRSEPSGRLTAPSFEELVTPGVKWGVSISRMQKHVGVNSEHLAATFHRVVEGVAVVNVDQMSAAVEFGEWAQLAGRIGRAEEKAQGNFHQFGHGVPAAGRLALQLGGKGVTENESGFHRTTVQ